MGNTYEQLRFAFMDRDFDGLSNMETVMEQGFYGPNEMAWRNEREFFVFVCAHTEDKSMRWSAAKAAMKAAEKAGESLKTVCAYMRRFVIPKII